MSHNHSHHHHHVHNYNRAFAIGISLNIIFVIIEVIYGISAESMALIADAGHNLSDVLTLLMAWGAYYLSKKDPTLKRTYGLQKVTILSALFSSILLFITLGAIIWESIERFYTPQDVNGMVVIIVAAIGVIINAATALLFMQGQKHDLNLRGAYLHMAADAGVSLGVVVIGIAIMFTGWVWLDPAISILIVLVILVSTWGLLKDSINLAIDAVPKHIDSLEIQNYLLSLDNVVELNHLHIWAISTTKTALSVHLFVSNEKINNNQINEIKEYLEHNFKIHHSTIQIENKL